MDEIYDFLKSRDVSEEVIQRLQKDKVARLLRKSVHLEVIIQHYYRDMVKTDQFYHVAVFTGSSPPFL